MPRQITIADIRPVSLTVSVGEENNVNLSVRYLRLDGTGEVIEGYVGVLSVELEGGMKQKVLNFVKNTVKQFVREQEGLE